MPFLSRRVASADSADGLGSLAMPAHSDKLPVQPRSRPGLLVSCGNPGCRSGWLHLTRSRSWPIFEDAWTCSPACTADRIGSAVARELNGRTVAASHQHRIPLGLLTLERGWISADQLKRARATQRAQGGRLGAWLVHHTAITEAQLTQALSLQWSCPVLSPEGFDPDGLCCWLPRIFAEGFNALPLRLAAGKLLYLGYEQAPDPVLELAVERMTGLRVAGGMVLGSQFSSAHARYLRAGFPGAEFLEAASEPALVHAFTRSVERTRPLQARLVRVHDWLWLRMWTQRSASGDVSPAGMRDVIGAVAVM